MAFDQTQVNIASKTFKNNVDLLRQIQLHLSDSATLDNNKFKVKEITIISDDGTKSITITPDGITINGVNYVSENDLEYNQVLLK